MINAVVFDIGSVLVRSQFREYFDAETNEKLINLTLRSDIWRKMGLGEATYNEVKTTVLNDNPDFANEIKHFFEVYQSTYTLEPDVFEFFKSQKEQGRKVLLLSNFGRELFEESIMPLEFYRLADGGVFSYQVHCAKPDPKIYQLLIDKYQLVPEECVFIDDQLKNVQAARACGMHAIHFQNIEQLQQDFAKL